MRLFFTRPGWAIALVLATFAIARAETPFAGTFSDGRLTVDLSAANGGYTGTISLGEQKFPATAQVRGLTLEGTFEAGANRFPFTATMDADGLILVSSGTTYRTHRVGGAVNPLADGQAADAPATPAGYRRVNSTEYGQVLAIGKSKATDVKSALESTFPELAQFFGDRPKTGGAYEDAKTHRSGGATFAARYNGKPVKGIISCRMVDQGATVVVIYCRVDAPADAWRKLTAAPAANGPAAADNPPPAHDTATLRRYEFPDGTGSIGVADGWKTEAKSIFNTISLQGPGDETISLGNNFIVETPNSPAMKQKQHFHESFYAADFTDPGTAILELWPQMSKNLEARGGPALHIDRIISQKPLEGSSPNDKASLIDFEVTRTANGTTTQFHNCTIFRMIMLGRGEWQMTTRGFSAPVATFDRDAPLMLAMVKSLKVNNDVTARVGQQKIDENNAVAEANLEAFKQRGIQQQKDHDAYMARTEAGYDEHNRQFRADQLHKSRHNADEVEMIIGLRKVTDTQTGLAAKVDYYNVDQIVADLNVDEPGRYRQIPLRDELYPVPGQRP